MATTSTFVYLKPQFSNAVSGNRSTSTTVYFGLRSVNGPYTSSGVTASRNLRGLRSYLPHRSVPIAEERDGRLLCTQEWYSFFNFFVNTYLDFNSAVTIADLRIQLTADQALAQATAAMALASVQQSNANAQALAAVVEVAQAAALPGSSQIPPVQLYPQEPYYGGGDAGGSPE